MCCGVRGSTPRVGCGPDCRVGSAPVPPAGVGFRVAGTKGDSCSGERGADPVPAAGDLYGPPPGLVDPESGLPGAVADPGGDVQHPVPERRDLAGGEVRFVGEADEFGPVSYTHLRAHET